MIFVFADDGTLEIIAGPEEAKQEYEGIDVEEGVYKFFDETGTRLNPNFIKPNKRSKFSVQSGEFELLPSTHSNEDDIFSHLNEASELNPNRWFNDLGEVKRFFENQRRSRL
jgi:hypothetical protein